MPEKKRIPDVRFKGFNDEWKECALNDISNKVTDKNAQMKYFETLTNSAEFGIISQRDYFDKDITNSENINGYYVVKNEDFVYNPRISSFAPVGPIQRNKLGRTGVMSPLYTVFRSYDVNKTFLEQFFKSNHWHAFMELNGDTGARADRLAIKDSIFMEMPIPYPLLGEQVKIGKILAIIDKLINLHQRKYEKLVNLKKAMLEKMFPKNGANVPEIRFKGFTEPWKESIFGECILIQRGGSPRPIENFITDDKNGINWIKIGDVSIGSRYITKTKEKIIPEGVKSSRKVQKGDLILSNSMSFGRPYIMAIDGCIHDGWLLIRDEKKFFDLEYLLQLLSSDYMLDQYKALASGGVVINLNSELVKSTIIFIPSPKEQTKIGSYFQKLDKLISLHQQELDKLKNIKKACLDKMFV